MNGTANCKAGRAVPCAPSSDADAASTHGSSAERQSLCNLRRVEDCAPYLGSERLLLNLFLIVLVAVSGVAAEKAKEEKSTEPTQEEKAGEAPSRVKRGPNGEITITLDAA